MKKLLALVMAGLMVFGLAGCGEAKDEAKDDKYEFKVGFDAEYPPYGYMDDDGSYTGFDLELAEAVCELKDWDIKYVPIEWNAKDMELKAGNIDCIWSGFTINGREDLYTWSDPYVENSQVVVVASESGIADLKGLSGKVVGVQSGSAALSLLEDEEGQKELADTFSELREFVDYNTAFAELMAGTIDALAMDIGVAKYQVNSRGEGYVILDEYLNEEQYGIGFRLEDTQLRDDVQEAIDSLKEDGTFDELAEKYELSDLVISE